MKRDLAQMNPVELVNETRRLREELHTSAVRMLEAGRLLYTLSRRGPYEERVATHLLYANMVTRMAGIVVQSARRFKSFDRLIVASTEEAAAPAPRITSVRPEPHPVLPDEDPLATLLNEDSHVIE